MMNWQIKEFNQLTTKELYEILKVRAEVFVVEQQCIFQDIDSKDEVSYHLFLEDHSEIVAYLRILPPNISYSEVAIGRVLTKAEHRKKGISKKLVQNAINFVTDSLGEQAIRISAQAYLLKFYNDLGFEPVSEVYLEDGIEHIEMLYRK
ncbi:MULTISPECIES: GNAT family N-acetyltransferase [Lysinibacillus]|uniref:GNAT family N-acetyltransferase n=1 Tax=Lysinibacillus TaxID=400634 RepID=UPI00257CC7D7|nr:MULTISPECIES: GNAT family N-acetyltransferase [Lysinibacillus]